MKTRIMYIEDKSKGLSGPARIGNKIIKAIDDENPINPIHGQSLLLWIKEQVPKEFKYCIFITK